MGAKTKEINISKNYKITIVNGLPIQIMELSSKSIHETGDSHYISSGTIRDVSIKEALDLGILDDLLI